MMPAAQSAHAMIQSDLGMGEVWARSPVREAVRTAGWALCGWPHAGFLARIAGIARKKKSGKKSGQV